MDQERAKVAQALAKLKIFVTQLLRRRWVSGVVSNAMKVGTWRVGIRAEPSAGSQAEFLVRPPGAGP